MEQLCVGSEHQGSMFRLKDRQESSRQALHLLHKELETLVQPKEVDKEENPADLSLSEDDDDSNFEDVVSGMSADSQ